MYSYKHGILFRIYYTIFSYILFRNIINYLKFIDNVYMINSDT